MNAHHVKQHKTENELSLLSYNIQGGIETRGFHHYFIKSWQHVLPHRHKHENLERVAGIISDYDIVALQETDAGSLRSSFTNLTEDLARKGHFPYWYNQVNRNIGKLAQHSNGLLSKREPIEISEHKLPGMIPGRGAIHARLKVANKELTIIVVHLALGKQTRMRQLGYISELIQSDRHVVLMGDMNCESHSKEMEYLYKNTHLVEPEAREHSFPSWQPKKNIDHILVSSNVKVKDVSVLKHGVSDHFPVSMTIKLGRTN